jgi:hypothetical protein
MKSGVERERLLKPQTIGAGRSGYDKNEIPAMGRYGARHQHEFVPGEQGVSEGLLACAGDSGPCPVRVRDLVRSDDMNAAGFGDRDCGQHVRNCVEGHKPLMNSNLENGGGRVD